MKVNDDAKYTVKRHGESVRASRLLPSSIRSGFHNSDGPMLSAAHMQGGERSLCALKRRHYLPPKTDYIHWLEANFTKGMGKMEALVGVQLQGTLLEEYRSFHLYRTS